MLGFIAKSGLFIWNQKLFWEFLWEIEFQRRLGLGKRDSAMEQQFWNARFCLLSSPPAAWIKTLHSQRIRNCKNVMHFFPLFPLLLHLLNSVGNSKWINVKLWSSPQPPVICISLFSVQLTRILNRSHAETLLYTYTRQLVLCHAGKATPGKLEKLL